MINKKNQNLVIVFAKKPGIGTTKTRIARETSANFAYEFTLACFMDLVNKIRSSSFYDLVVVTDTAPEASWFEKNYGVESIFMDLSEKERKSKGYTLKFNYLFPTMTNTHGYRKVILVPMDVPFLTEEELVTAFSYLGQHKYVVGPETDGGVYLIGMKSPYDKNIFKEVPWSTPYSCQKLLANMSAGGKTYKLKYKSDFNTFQIVLNHKREIELHCPEVFRLLERNGYYIPSDQLYVDYDSLEIRVPITACLVEKREKNKKPLLLVQTRFKPAIDPSHSGLMEIPGGLLEKTVSVEEAAIREVREETGIDSEIVNYRQLYLGDDGNKEKAILTVDPFCCVQQLIGKRNYVGIVFLAKFTGGKLKENYRESKDPRWISLKELKQIVEKKPERIFSLYLPVFEKYLKFNGG